MLGAEERSLRRQMSKGMGKEGLQEENTGAVGAQKMLELDLPMGIWKPKDSDVELQPERGMAAFWADEAGQGHIGEISRSQRAAAHTSETGRVPHSWNCV